MSIDKIDNISAIVKVKYTFFENLVETTSDVDEYYTLYLKHNTDFEQISGTFETIDFSDVKKTSAAGEYNEITLKLLHPNDDKYNQKQIEELLRHRLIISVEYQNGLSKAFGQLHPALALSDFSAKGMASGRNIIINCKTSVGAKYFEYSVLEN